MLSSIGGCLKKIALTIIQREKSVENPSFYEEWLVGWQTSALNTDSLQKTLISLQDLDQGYLGYFLLNAVIFTHDEENHMNSFHSKGNYNAIQEVTCLIACPGFHQSLARMPLLCTGLCIYLKSHQKTIGVFGAFFRRGHHFL